MIAVFLKEIRILLRSSKAFGLLLTTLLIVGGTLGLLWLALAQGENMIDRRAALGRQFFIFIATIQFCIMGLTAALMSATAITSEREGGTLELLLATGIPRARLLFGKWLAAVFFQFIVAICLLPILALVFQLGSVGADEVLFAVAMTALTVMAYGMAGLAVSCRCRKTGSALFQTFFYTGFHAIGGLFLAGISMDWRSMMPAGFWSSLVQILFISTSPLATWSYLLFNWFGKPSQGLLLTSPVFLGHVVVQGLIFLVALRLALRSLARQSMSIDEDQPQPMGMAPAGEVPANWPVPPRVRESHWQAIGDHQNPFIVKEFNTWMGRSTDTLTPVIVIFMLISFFLILRVLDGNYKVVIQVLGTTTTTLLMLVIPLYAAPAISREREAKTLELLRTAPCTTLQLVQAKFRAILRVAMILFAVLVSCSFIVRILVYCLDSSQPGNWRHDGALANLLGPTLLLALPVLAFSCLYIALGIYCSSRQRRILPALFQTYMILGLMMFLPLPIGVGLHLLGYSSSGVFVQFTSGIFLSLINHFHYFLESPSDGGLLCFASQRSFPELGCWMSLHAALVLALAYGLLRAAARCLEKEG